MYLRMYDIMSYLVHGTYWYLPISYRLVGIIQRYCNENGEWELLSTVDVRANTTNVLSNLNDCFQSHVVTFIRQAHGIPLKAYQVRAVRTSRVPNVPTTLRYNYVHMYVYGYMLRAHLPDYLDKCFITTHVHG